MTQFHTNVDCAKRLVSNLSLGVDDVHFQVGDKVVVFEEEHTKVVMEVASRTWKFHKAQRNPMLQIELTIARQFANITAFENFLKSRGLPIH